MLPSQCRTLWLVPRLVLLVRLLLVLLPLVWRPSRPPSLRVLVLLWLLLLLLLLPCRPPSRLVLVLLWLLLLLLLLLPLGRRHMG